MTEEEWVTCTDPAPMWEYVRGKTSDRKRYLFGCACCRRIWHILTDERSRRAVEVGERFVDGLATEAERKEAAVDANEVFFQERIRPVDLQDVPALDAYHMAYDASAAAHGKVYRDDDDDTILDTDFGYQPAVAAAYYRKLTNSFLREGEPARDDFWDVFFANERVAQSHLFHDIIGNPFHPVPMNPAWLSSTVQNLAESIYTDRAFDRLPILADALEDAGCTSQEILEHCRSSGGEHVRGCWALDLVLGKE